MGTELGLTNQVFNVTHKKEKETGNLNLGINNTPYSQYLLFSAIDDSESSTKPVGRRESQESMGEGSNHSSETSQLLCSSHKSLNELSSTLEVNSV